jgi:hypothetical protein
MHRNPHPKARRQAAAAAAAAVAVEVARGRRRPRRAVEGVGVVDGEEEGSHARPTRGLPLGNVRACVASGCGTCDSGRQVVLLIVFCSTLPLLSYFITCFE